jgi:peptidoglycan/xylan/chitin deacetylase (PgdA/CDA1 family)
VTVSPARVLSHPGTRPGAPRPPASPQTDERAPQRGVKLALYRAACLMGCDDIARWYHRRELVVIAYHGLRDGPAPAGAAWPLLPVEEFERQIRHLAAHYHVRFIDDAVQMLRAGPLAESTVCITFDDGYRSNRALALPVLQQYGAPATVYLTTGMIGTKRLIWTIELDLAFQQTHRSSMDLGFMELGVVALTSVAQRARTSRTVIGQLKPLAPAARDALLARIREQLGVDAPEHDGAFTMMDWDEVASMEQSGLVSFGGHTVNHEIVTRLDDAELQREISGSMSTVRQRVKRVSATFAYPNGGIHDFDSRAAAVVAACGGIGAVTTIEGLSHAGTDPFQIRRFNVGSNMSIDEFRLLTSGVLRRWAREYPG